MATWMRLHRVRVWAVYTLFPDYQDIQSWRRRARILVFGCIKDRQTKDIQEQLKQQGWAAALDQAPGTTCQGVMGTRALQTQTVCS